MRIAIIFDNFGPYHLARLRAASQVCELLAIEVAEESAEYEWKRRTENERQRMEEGGWPAEGKTRNEKQSGKATNQKIHELGATENGNEFQLSASSVSGFKHVTLFDRGTSREISCRELEGRLNRALDVFQPQVVFIPGWSSQAAFAALRWCGAKKIPVAAMSESTEWDEIRSGWREAVKRRIVGLCSAALAGGTPHKDYMVKLGMPSERIFLGYDAVDNGYFVDKTAGVRGQKPEVRKKHGLPENYFLASARFIEKKNLPRLLEAYALYRKKSEAGSQKPGIEKQQSKIWNLVLLGDGVLRETLNSQISTLKLHAYVQMPGFKQYPDLPAYYGLAGAFIHASTTEQWGLVVNEAMASGLPVLVSNRCGCAQDLVQEGVNGFTFDPCNVEQLAQLMFQVSAFQPFRLSEFGNASRKIISNWGPERFAEGLKAATAKALAVGPKRSGFLGRMILSALMRR